MKNHQIWLDAEYKQNNRRMMGKEFAECLLQKKIWDDRGIKYFINVYYYQHQEWDSYSADVQFKRGEDDKEEVFSIHVHQARSPEYLEETVEAFWKNMGMGYYREDWSDRSLIVCAIASIQWFVNILSVNAK